MQVAQINAAQLATRRRLVPRRLHLPGGEILPTPSWYHGRHVIENDRAVSVCHRPGAEQILVLIIQIHSSPNRGTDCRDGDRAG